MSTYISSLSNPDLSQPLSEGSTLSSESDHSQDNARHHSTPTPSMADKKKKKPSKPKKSTTTTTITLPAPTHAPKKNAKQVKEEPLYCICRQGYDGKQFMIACDTCHEWFHGRCVGISPKSVIKNYYCDACQAKPTKKKTASQDTSTVKAPNGKGRGKKANAKKVTTTPSRKKSTAKTNTTAFDPSPPAPLPSQQTSSSTTITTSAAQDDDEDEDLDDICPICEFECTCGTSSTSVSVSAPPPTPVVVTSIDTPTKPSPTSRKGTIKKQPKKQSAKSRKGKSAKKATHFTPLSDEEDVDILEDDDDDYDDYDNNLLSAALDDDGDGDSLVMDPFSSDEELFSDEDGNSDGPLDNLSPYPDSHLGSYTSSIHIDSGDDDEDIEQEEERAIIAEMMEHEGLSDNLLDDKKMTDGENGGYFVEDDDSEDLDDYDMDDDSTDASDEGDVDADHGNNVEDDDDEAHAYYLRTNGLWASSEEEDDDDEDEDLGFHSDPGPIHDGISDDDDPTDLVALLGNDSTLFNNIAEAFMQVLAPLADAHHTHSDGITPTNETTPTAATSTVTPISALSALNVATFDLGSNAAACLNSAPTSPTGHRLDDYLRRPSLPSNALLAAAHSHREMDLASDALSALSSVLSAEALGLSLHPTPASTKGASPAKLAKGGSGELESAASGHGQQQKQQQLSAPDLSTASSSSSSSSSPPATSLYDSVTASTSITPPENAESLPPSPTPRSSQQSTTIDISSSLTSPNSPQPSYDLASLLPPDMKIPEQLLELIKSSLAASINEKGTTPASSPTTPTAAKSSSSSSTATATKAVVSGSSSTLARQLLPKPTTDSPTIESSTENDKKRPLSIVTQLGKKRARSDEDKNDSDEDALVSMDELLDTSQLDARPEDGTSDAADDRFARDLSRWERVPIGAFRLMRSKNRLWLNR